MTITLRQESATGATTKGSALTYSELDNNFIHLLRQGSVTVRGDSGTEQTLGEADKDSILQIAGGTNVTTTISSDSAGETVITIDATSGGISNVVEDTTPQLGGNLDVNGNNIVGATAGGGVTIQGGGSGGATNITLSPGGTGNVVLSNLTFPNSDGTTGQVLYTNGTGTLAFKSITEATGSELSNVVEDTTPQLGGTLDGQANTVQDIQLENYKETIYSLGSTDSPTVDVANGNVQSVTITSGLSLAALSNGETGQSVTLLVSGTGSITTSSGTWKFANGEKTLTNDSIVSIFYDGTTHWASVATNFSA